MPLARPILTRLLDLLDIQGPDDCWLWKGRVHKSGYAYISKGGKGGAMLLMHRVSWCEHNNCVVSEGKDILHDCDVPLCGNPRHLDPGTHLQNMQQKVARGRQARNRGTDAGNSKLTDDLVRIIRADERSQRTIAAELGVDQTLISMVKLRKVWTHVT